MSQGKQGALVRRRPSAGVRVWVVAGGGTVLRSVVRARAGIVSRLGSEAGVRAVSQPGSAGAMRTLVGAVLVGLLLAGCGGDPGPQPVVLTEAPTEWPTELLGPSPTPHDTPSEEPPEEPTPDADEAPQPPVWDPALNEPTVDNALAFGQYFMELYSYVVATGDTSEWRELSHPDCLFCASLTETAEQGMTDDVQLVLAPISGDRIDGEYFAVDYDLSQWIRGVEDERSLIAHLGVINVGRRWQTHGVQIDPYDG